MKRTWTIRRAATPFACISALALLCRADVFVEAPTPPPGQIGGPTLTSSYWPFLIKQYGYSSMRYQQVYNASLFTNLDRSLIYITTLTFHLYPFGNGANSWTVTNIQINLSTTQQTADHLSTSFTNNIGPDDTAVFGPKSYLFAGGYAGANLQVVFDTPFRYDPSRGSLLLDVRIFNGTGPDDPLEPMLWTYTTSTDEVSRVWAPDVSATVATGVDTSGLYTGIQFNGIPTLTIQFYPVYAGTESNIFEVEWPGLPSTFLLQRSDSLGLTASWQTIRDGILGSPPGERGYTFPAATAGRSGFFRLVWPNGYGASADPQHPFTNKPTKLPLSN